MAQVTLINRSDVPNEPAYNVSDEAVDEPVQSCPLANEEKEEEEEPVQKITQSYFTNLDGERIEEITTEEEVYFVLESENMEGEEAIIDLPGHIGDFKYGDEIITDDKLLKISISNAVEKIKLEVILNSNAVPSSKVGQSKTHKSKGTGKKSTTERPPEKKKDRELKRIVFKRKAILWGEIIGVTDPSGRDTYGHWWVEIDESESYGYWPDGQVGFIGTITGVDGSVNRGQVQDPHHGDIADEEFSPVIKAEDERTTDEIIKCIGDFAKSYKDTVQYWAYPALKGNHGNCHTFQESMMKHCNLETKGTVTHYDPEGNVTSTDSPKKTEVEEVYE